MPHSYMNTSLNRILRNIGVTRISEISKFDDLPVYVYQAVRPNALHIKVDSGKGVSRRDSYLSAAVESIERFTAENIANKIYSVPIGLLPDDIVSTYLYGNEMQRTIAALKGMNLIDGSDCFIPFDMCSYHVFSPIRTISRFSNGSTGLGAHFSLSMAVLSGMLEIIERDAIARNTIIKFTMPDCARIYNLLRFILEKVPSIQVKQYHSCAGIIVISITSNQLSVNGGFNAFGTGFTLENALEDALLEAMQTWTLRICASRDDLAYGLSPYYDSRVASHILTLNSLPSYSDSEPVRAEHTRAPKYSDENYDQLIRYFRDTGTNIYMVRLKSRVNIAPVHVARIVIPSSTPLRQGPALTGFPILPV